MSNANESEDNRRIPAGRVRQMLIDAGRSIKVRPRSRSAEYSRFDWTDEQATEALCRVLNLGKKRPNG